MSIPEADRCSVAWRRSGLPPWGTAAESSFWVAVEAPGPWGRQALVESDLDPDLGRRLDETTSGLGGHAVLVRRPGVGAAEQADTRTVFVAGGFLDAPWLAARTVPASELAGAVEHLLDHLQHQISPPEGYLRSDEPVLLVCTNGKRDRCCAISGRRVAADLDGDPRVWESSHLHGHRFAPTGLALPTGQMIAYLDAGLARTVLDAGTRLPLLPLGHDRGRTGLPKPVQAADAYLRRMIDETDPVALSYSGEPAELLATHRDGRTWNLVVEQEPGGQLAESCGKQAVPVFAWRVSEA